MKVIIQRAMYYSNAAVLRNGIARELFNPLAANAKAIRFYEQIGFALCEGSETTVISNCFRNAEVEGSIPFCSTTLPSISIS